MEKATLFQRFADVVPGIIIGVLLGLFWNLLLGMIFVAAAWEIMWGAKVDAASLYFLAPPVSIIALAMVFSCLRKHNVVSGILLVAIGYMLYFGYPVFRTFYAWRTQH